MNAVGLYVQLGRLFPSKVAGVSIELAYYALLFSGNRSLILCSATLAAALRILAASSLILGLDGSLFEPMFLPADTIFGQVHINLTPCPEPFRSHRDLPVFDQGLEKLFCFSPIDRAGLDDGVQNFSLREVTLNSPFSVSG
jgi:hypothetical protein